MGFVLDCSFLSSLFLPDENSEEVVKFFRENRDCYVPSLFWFEINNVISVSCKRKRISRKNTDKILALLEALPIKTISRLDQGKILEISLSFNISSYDASYLVLAMELNSQLATFDRAMILASRELGIDTTKL